MVSGCDMRGYTAPGAPLSAAGITSNLFVYDCLGYNDQSTPLNGGAAPTMSTSAATCSTPYFGPSVVAFSSSGPVQIHVFGQTLTLQLGVIFLPSPYDGFFFTPTAPTNFSLTGQ
jgi:hypothetical protein